MNFNSVPSLEYTTIVQIVVRLWSEFEVIKEELFTFSSFCHITNAWENLEEKLYKKVEALPLPLQVRKKIILFIKPIGFELIKWIVFQQELLPQKDIIRNLNKCHWTPLGMIDRRKTSKVLIRDENIDVRTRYELAHVYCYESELSTLWHQKMLTLGGRQSNKLKEDDKPFVIYWSAIRKRYKGFRTHVYQSEPYPNRTLIQCAFENAAITGNKDATEYFFQKLSLKEKKASLFRTAENVAKSYSAYAVYYSLDPIYHQYLRSCSSGHTNTLCFLLSQMNEQQQILLLQRKSFPILRLFLKWPWQNLFIDAVKYTCSYLQVKEFKTLLDEILDCIIMSNNYENLLPIFWKESPTRLRKFITDNLPFSTVLSKLQQIEDEESIKLILKDIT